MKRFYICSILAACLISSSCSKPAPEAEEAPPPLPKTFAFTDTNSVVDASELESAEDESALKADFNQDGLSDLAIIKKEGEIQSKVEIYIQKKPDPKSTTAEKKPQYFRGGTIERPVKGKISAIASAKEGKVVNIIVLVTHSNQPNQYIHYRNDGGSFTEVDF